MFSRILNLDNPIYVRISSVEAEIKKKNYSCIILISGM